MDADAIVIGAGAAGLAAARSLASRSLRTIVLEARDRCGGRIWPIPSKRAAVPAELGAEFIHGPAQETMALLRDAGSAAIDSVGESWTLRDGVLQRDDNDRFITAAALFEGAQALCGDESVARFLQRFEPDPAMREAVDAARRFVEGFDAADPAIASVQSIAQEWQSGVDFAGARPLGGYGPMLEHLRAAGAFAGVHIRLSTIVRAVSWYRGSVTIETASGSGEPQTLRSRIVVITVPAGVLRLRAAGEGIAFDPELPPLKREALGHIVMGDVVKVVLRFRSPFWEDIHDGRYRDAAFFRSRGEPFASYWTQYPVRSESVVAWAGGPKATALSGVSQPELIARAVDEFGAIFGERARASKEFEAGVMHDWSTDPFARGAYSYVATGGATAHAALAAPIDDTLFFAGEATSDDGQAGTVNGALVTGMRAAEQAAASLGARA